MKKVFVTPSLNQTAHSFFKVINNAKTIAKLAGEKAITSSHLAEALQYHPKDTDF